MKPSHDRKHFYKYMPLATAEAVLASRTLRWSSPILFNDPFDVPRELSFGISSQQILEATKRYIAKLIENPPNDTNNFSPTLKLLVETVKNGIPSNVLKSMLDGLQDFSSSSLQTSNSMNKLRDMWAQSIPSLRILCLTESPAHAAMWYHYADRYAGIVLQLQCNEHTDSPWLIARRVDYPIEKPAIYTADGWAELLALKNDMAVNSLIDMATYTKSRDWAYENEWRLVSYMRPSDSGLFTDYQFNADDLTAIYFGPLVSEDERNKILKLLSDYPSAKAISVSLNHSREFVFDEIVG